MGRTIYRGSTVRPPHVDVRNPAHVLFLAAWTGRIDRLIKFHTLYWTILGACPTRASRTGSGPSVRPRKTGSFDESGAIVAEEGREALWSW